MQIAGSPMLKSGAPARIFFYPGEKSSVNVCLPVAFIETSLINWQTSVEYWQTPVCCYPDICRILANLCRILAVIY